MNILKHQHGWQLPVVLCATIALIVLLSRHQSSLSISSGTSQTTTRDTPVVITSTTKQITPDIQLGSPTPLPVFHRDWPSSELILRSGKSGMLNQSPANQTVFYSNAKFGIKVIELPFNKQWGEPVVQLMPFDEETSEARAVLFGPLQVLEGGIDRSFRLDVLPHRSVVQIQQETGEAVSQVFKTMHGYYVAEYNAGVDEVYGCNLTRYEVIGVTQNYLVSPPCVESYAPSETIAFTAINSLMLLDR